MLKAYLFCILLLLLWFLFSLLKRTHQGFKSYRWHETKGVIRESKILDLGMSMLTTGSSARQYSVHILYEYQVNSEVLEGQRLHLLAVKSSLSRKSIERLLTGYPVGKEVKVHYDPFKPAEAVLEKGLNRATLFSFIAISVFNAAIIVMILKP